MLPSKRSEKTTVGIGQSPPPPPSEADNFALKASAEVRL